jgi:hypothetical protein
VVGLGFFASAWRIRNRGVLTWYGGQAPPVISVEPSGVLYPSFALASRKAERDPIPRAQNCQKLPFIPLFCSWQRTVFKVLVASSTARAAFLKAEF